MPTLGRESSVGRTWFVTVRLVEVAAALMLAGAMYESWLFTSTYPGTYDTNGELDTSPSLAERATMFAAYGSGGAPLRLLVVVLLVFVVLAVLHLGHPDNPGVLRWELATVWGSTAAADAVLLAASAVGLLRGNPSDPGSYGGVGQGPTLVQQLLSTLATPLATAVLLAAAGLWWARLRSEGEATEEGEATGGAGEEPLTERPRQGAAQPPVAVPAHRPRQVVLDGVRVEDVEHIEAVERLRPRAQDGDDGGSSSGYDDYLRRF
ncbi:hypothetical protein [Pedococcus sp. 5OH_020]|uniref:hypothetical protein n=1 Tax=Pedococcus sp. 5OH_020 TaxID=2989814 RepID=UPI0022E9D4C7|nr:hypothetical protein [Pedococcus sp. 5OH_020]